MTDLDAKRRLTQRAIIDALAPLFGPKGIVAAHIVVFVAGEEDAAFPVVCSFALHPEIMHATLAGAVELLEAATTRGHDEAFVLAVAAKN